MKTAAKYSFIFFFLSAFLLSSFRITVNKMQCLGSGKISYSLSEAEDCCPADEKQGTSIDIDCCEFSKITFQTSISELLKHDFSKKISFPCKAFFSVVLAKLPTVLISSADFTDTSPPLSGVHILSLISIFRI